MIPTPTKKVKIFGAVVFVGVFGIIAYPHISKISTLFSGAPTENNQIDLVPLDETLLARDGEFFAREGTDSDRDGLRDWEESLWGTDPNNPDTDGDGTEDGIEVNKGRNPLVPGPSDLIVSGSTADFLLAQRSSSGPQPGNVSDVLSQGLFTTYVGAKEGNLSNTEQADKINSIATDALGSVKFQDFYTEKSFTTSPATDLGAIKKYGNELALAQVNLLDALSKAAPEGSTQYTYLSVIYSGHTKVLSGFSKIPETLLETHIAITNNFANLASALYSIEEYETDPAKALFSLQQYDEIRKNVEGLISPLPAFFRNNGIVFNDNEYGKIWR